ncbi:MAG: NADH-ubiquinone dehydrogenase [Mesorhizobium sp.]
MSGDSKDNRQGEGQADVTAELLAHPLALPAIAATIGMGMATQVLGFWMGAMSGSLQAGRRAMGDHTPIGGTAADTSSLPKVAAASAQKSRQAVKSMVETAQSKAAAAKRLQGETNVVPLRKPKSVDGAKAAEPPKVAERPEKDDLKLINGVGPKLEQMLNKLGVTSFAQVASWTGADIERIEKHFGFPGRIERDGWVAQAAARLGGKAAS